MGDPLIARYRRRPALVEGVVSLTLGAAYGLAILTNAQAFLMIIGLPVGIFVIAHGVSTMLRAGRTAVIVDASGIEVRPPFRIIGPLDETVRVSWNEVTSWERSVWPSPPLGEKRIVVMKLSDGAAQGALRQRGMVPWLFRRAPAWRGKLIVFLRALDRAPEDIETALTERFGPAVAGRS